MSENGTLGTITSQMWLAEFELSPDGPSAVATLVPQAWSSTAARRWRRRSKCGPRILRTCPRRPRRAPCRSPRSRFRSSPAPTSTRPWSPASSSAMLRRVVAGVAVPGVRHRAGRVTARRVLLRRHDDQPPVTVGAGRGTESIGGPVRRARGVQCRAKSPASHSNWRCPCCNPPTSTARGSTPRCRPRTNP